MYVESIYVIHVPVGQRRKGVMLFMGLMIVQVCVVFFLMNPTYQYIQLCILIKKMYAN